jgi:hypothetical protein
MSTPTAPTRHIPPVLRWLAAFLILAFVLSLAVTLGFSL